MEWSIRAGGLDEEGEDDWGSSEFGDREIERESLGSPSEDAGGESEMFVRPPVCLPRRVAEVERQVEEYFPQAVDRWSSKVRASMNVVGSFGCPSFDLHDTALLLALLTLTNAETHIYLIRQVSG